MLNKITIMGRLTRDPELRRTQSDVSIVSFCIACDRDFKKEDKQTDFIDVVAWRQTADFVSKFFTKGRMAVIDGRLQIREWTDKDGNKRKTAEILADSVYFGVSKKEASASSESGGQYDASNQGQFAELTDDSDELPF